MPQRLSLFNFDELFEQAPPPKTILNDLPSDTEEDRKVINNLIMTTYDNTDVLSTVPTCECGHLTMGINLHRLCPQCNTPVQRPVESQIGLNVWMRVPDGIKAFVNPTVWGILHNLLRIGANAGYSILDWVTNPTQKLPTKISGQSLKRLQFLESIEWPRGYNNFIDNYDRFIELLPQLQVTRADDYVRFFRYYRNKTFSQYLPMPTKTLIVLEKTSVGKFADLSVTGAVDAAKIIVSLSRDDCAPTGAYLERRAVGVMRGISTYFFETVKESLSKKKGWLRGQVLSSRSHFCMRGVITSISEPHYYEELHVPWAQGLEIFKYHILNKLFKRGMSEEPAYHLVESSGKVYNPLLDEIMREIINEFPPFLSANTPLSTSYYLPPRSGVPLLFQRNPSLTRASAQNFFITKIKSDVEDYTFSLSVLCLKGPNADFDGDEMNGTLLLDKRLADAGSFLRPHYAIHSLSNLGKFSSNIALPDVTSSVIANWLNND